MFLSKVSPLYKIMAIYTKISYYSHSYTNNFFSDETIKINKINMTIDHYVLKYCPAWK